MIFIQKKPIYILFIFKNNTKTMKRRKLFLLIILAILLLAGYAFCAAPLMAFSAIHYYGTIAAWTAWLITMEEIFWDILSRNDKNNDETKN